MLTYNNTLIVPLMCSKIKSRFSDEVNTSVDLNGSQLSMPLISSPMDSIDNPEFFIKLRQLGGIGIMHRFMAIENQVKLFRNIVLNKIKLHNSCALNTPIEKPFVICAIGINGDWKHRFDSLYKAGVKHFLIDVANGFCEKIVPVIQTLKDANCWIMAGNVADGKGYDYLDSLGVDAVRVGIGTGSMCTTRKMTGIGYPILSAIQDCSNSKGRAAIIADGGIKDPSDAVKALFCGADAVLMGNVFSRCLESTPGLKLGSTRVYRGMASYSAQKDAGKEVKAVEGEESVVKVDKTLEDVVTFFSGGLRSAMSYLNANTIAEMREGGRLIEVSPHNREGYR